MNILMTSTFFPPHVGGVEYHVLNLAKHLVNRGNRVIIVTSLLPKMRPYELLDGIEIVRIETRFLSGWPYRSLSSVGITPYAGRTMLRIIKEKDVDLVHAHGHHYPLTWNALNIAHELGVPSVLTLHGMYAMNPTNPVARAVEEVFNLTILKRELKKASVVIGLTPTITDFARRYGPSSSTYFTIPNGVDTKTYSENIAYKKSYREKYEIPERKVVVLFRGRFSNVKGILELAEAARVLAQEHKDLFFLFVGDGPLHDRLLAILKSTDTNSRIAGWTSASEVHEAYIASDIFVLPSKWEALPITLIEAMASHLHIVATTVGGIKDVLSGYPWKTYIDGFSPSHITKALKTALHSVCTNGNETGDVDVGRYDWSQISEEVANVYRAFVKVSAKNVNQSSVSLHF